MPTITNVKSDDRPGWFTISMKNDGIMYGIIVRNGEPPKTGDTIPEYIHTCSTDNWDIWCIGCNIPPNAFPD